MLATISGRFPLTLHAKVETWVKFCKTGTILKWLRVTNCEGQDFGAVVSFIVTACVSYRSTDGVENKWRELTPDRLHREQTTGADGILTEYSISESGLDQYSVKGTLRVGQGNYHYPDVDLSRFNGLRPDSDNRG